MNATFCGIYQTAVIVNTVAISGATLLFKAPLSGCFEGTEEDGASRCRLLAISLRHIHRHTRYDDDVTRGWASYYEARLVSETWLGNGVTMMIDDMAVMFIAS